MCLLVILSMLLFYFSSTIVLRTEKISKIGTMSEGQWNGRLLNFILWIYQDGSYGFVQTTNDWINWLLFLKKNWPYFPFRVAFKNRKGVSKFSLA